MTIYEDILHTRVARYEAALGELLAAHQDVKGVLLDQILYERWQQVGADLGYLPSPHQPDAGRPHRDLAALNHQIPELSESWAG
jgi:hypothetical protein